MNKRVDLIYQIAKENKNLSCESLFSESPMYSYMFALELKKSRLKNENVFLKDMSYALLYSKNVIKGRLPEEIEFNTFLNTKVISYYYGKKIESSLVILDSYYYILEYFKFINKLPEKLHNFMLLGCLNNNLHAINYVNSLSKRNS